MSPSPVTQHALKAELDFSHPIHEKGQAALHEALNAFVRADQLANETETIEHIDSFLRNVIENQGLFGTAMHLLKEVADLTEYLNKQIDGTRRLRKPSKGAIAKAEVLRTVLIAHYLEAVIIELNKAGRLKAKS